MEAGDVAVVEVIAVVGGTPEAPSALYSNLNPFSVPEKSDRKLIKITLVEETRFGGKVEPQYFPSMGDALESPSKMAK